MSAASVAASKAIGQATDDAIRQALTHHPSGMTYADIVAATGFGEERVVSAVRRMGPTLARAKILEHRGAPAVLVTLPGNVDWMRVRCSEDVRKRQIAAKAKKKSQNARAKERRIDREIAAVGDADEKPFRHRIVPASQAKPLLKLGPASVWELAA
jgi:hypothetical protein